MEPAAILEQVAFALSLVEAGVDSGANSWDKTQVLFNVLGMWIFSTNYPLYSCYIFSF